VPENYPAPPPRASARRIEQVLALVEVEGRFLLFRRSASAGQLASLWEFPAVELAAERAPAEELAVRFGGTWSLGSELFRLRHAITNRSFAIEVRRASLVVADGVLSESAEGAEAGWWSRGELAGLPLTGVARKVLARRVNQPG
jgi:adenine-specific DNA glycosylase